MSVDKYAEFLFLNHIMSGDFDRQAADRWMLASELRQQFIDALDIAFENRGYDIGGRYHEMVDLHLKGMGEAGVIAREGDRYTGEFSSIGINSKDEYAKRVLKDSEVAKRISRLGDEALSRALASLSLEEGWRSSLENDLPGAAKEGAATIAQIEVPAADRVVRLDHNQIGEANASLSEIVEALEQDNGDPDQPGLRERLLGQIKAGRELIRAGEYKAYLLYEVLVRALGELIKRYTNPAIVALANALLGAVVSQLLQAS